LHGDSILEDIELLTFENIPNFKTFDGINKKKIYGQRPV